MHALIKKLDSIFNIPAAGAHCDIPCKIYDPFTAQMAALSVIRFLDLIAELEQKSDLTLAEQATFVRLMNEKEVHAEKVKEEVRIIWGDYFKSPQLDQFPNTHDLVHRIMLAASACKQHIEKERGDTLLNLVNEFAESFWATKNVPTYTACCPYPPAKNVVYPLVTSN